MDLPYPKTCFTLYILTLTTVSLLPADQLSAATSINDKIAHFLCYTLLALLAASLQLTGTRHLQLCAGLALYGFCLEGAQFLVPGRDCSLLDALANSAGLATGFALVLIHSRFKHRQATM